MIDYEYFYNMFSKELKQHKNKIAVDPRQNLTFFQMVLLESASIKKLYEEMDENVPAEIKKKFKKLIKKYDEIISLEPQKPYKDDLLIFDN